MRYFLVFVMVFLTFCTRREPFFYRKFYEETTGIKLPEKYVVIETVNKREWLSEVTLKIDSASLLRFVKENKFVSPSGEGLPDFEASKFMEKETPVRDKIGDIYYKRDDRDLQINWLYIVDTKKGLLWMEIVYTKYTGS